MEDPINAGADATKVKQKLTESQQKAQKEDELVKLKEARALSRFKATKDAVAENQKKVEELEVQHQERVAKAKQEISQLQFKKDVICTKQEKIPSMERYISDLYLEFHPQLMESDGPDRKLLQELKEWTCSHSSLVVLDTMKRNLREWTSKSVSTIEELQKQIQQAKQAETDERERYKDELNSMRESVDLALAKEEEATQKWHNNKTETENARKRFTRRYQDLVAQQEALQAEYDFKCHKADGLKTDVEIRDGIMEHKESQLVKLTQLERQLAKTKKAHQVESAELKVQAGLDNDKLQHEASAFFRQNVDNKALGKELQDAKKQLHGMKLILSRNGTARNEQKTNDTRKRIQEWELEKEKLDRNLKQLEEETERLKRKNGAMRSEYSAFVYAVNEDQDEHRNAEVKNVMEQIRKMHKEQGFSSGAGYWREQVASKEREIKKISNKFKNSILNQHRDLQLHEIAKQLVGDEITDFSNKRGPNKGNPTEGAMIRDKISLCYNKKPTYRGNKTRPRPIELAQKMVERQNQRNAGQLDDDQIELVNSTSEFLMAALDEDELKEAMRIGGDAEDDFR